MSIENTLNNGKGLKVNVLRGVGPPLSSFHHESMWYVDDTKGNSRILVMASVQETMYELPPFVSKSASQRTTSISSH